MRKYLIRRTDIGMALDKRITSYNSTITDFYILSYVAEGSDSDILADNSTLFDDSRIVNHIRPPSLVHYHGFELGFGHKFLIHIGLTSKLPYGTLVFYHTQSIYQFVSRCYGRSEFGFVYAHEIDHFILNPLLTFGIHTLEGKHSSCLSHTF